MNVRRILAIAIFSLILPHAKSQLTPGQGAQLVQLNTITTAVPFLMIGPDSRSGALGDAGVALSPDANSLHWNPAKMALLQTMSNSVWVMLHGCALLLTI